MNTSKHDQHTYRRVPPLAFDAARPAAPAMLRDLPHSRPESQAPWEPHDGWQPIRLRRSIDDLAAQLDGAVSDQRGEGQR